MAYSFPTNPAALGIVTVASPDTPVSLLSAVPAAQNQGFMCQAIEVEAMKDAGKTANSGLVYIGASDMNKTTGAGVIKTLAVGESWSYNAIGNQMAPDNLYLDAANADDGVQVRAFVR